MPLAPSTRLGPYEIVALLGAGGMGEVYRAREFRPGSNSHPAIRFSLAPDGKSFVYAAATMRSNLWMLTGALKP